MDTNTIWRKGANAGGGEGSHQWFSQGDAHGSHTAHCTQCASNSVHCTPGLRIGISMRLEVDKEVEIEMDEGEGVEGSHKWLLRDAPRLQFGLSMGAACQ